MSVKRKSSFVWKYFEKDEYGRPFATCLLCKKEYRASGNPTNLKDHFNRFHKNQVSDESETESEGESCSKSSKPKQKQQKLSLFLRKPSTKYLNTDARKLKLDRLLGCMIATDFQPYSIVTDRGFRTFVKELDPRYDIPFKYSLSTKIIPTLFNEATEKLAEVFNNVNYVFTDQIKGHHTAEVIKNYLQVFYYFIN